MEERTGGATEVALVEAAQVPPAVTARHRTRALAHGGRSLRRWLVGGRPGRGRAARAAKSLLLPRSLGALLAVRCRPGEGHTSDRHVVSRYVTANASEFTDT